MNIILFNGPPGCGKDTAAQWLWQNWHGNNNWVGFPGYPIFDRLSMPIKRAFAGTFGGNLNAWGENDKWENKKDAPHELLNGKSYRQWQIEFSEKFMKPLYGEDIFSKLFCNRIRRYNSPGFTILVPDCGFDVEAHTIQDRFPEANLVVIKIFRPGKDFSSDSRDYLSPLSIHKAKVWEVHNISTQEIYLKKISDTLSAVL